ncbi:hypothetical protein [Sulfuricurvum sp.]|uniref:hypothetical protein n=1 Tax=Sulfuricurvum sp. TaxID=2025608 RepID=UPI0026288438|nr:hypothetical protein [Sulfuricurvum sp.]MDD2780930.1 hypothetical protein [Sulfuricurvum sp.]
MIPLDEYENELLESVENGEWVSKGNVDERLRVLQSYIKNQNKKARFPIYLKWHVKSGMTEEFTSFALSLSKGI